MQLHELPQADKDELMQMVMGINAWANAKLGGEQEVVLVVHEAHAKGAECHGVEIVTPVSNPEIIAGMLDQALDAITEFMVQTAKPAGVRLN